MALSFNGTTITSLNYNGVAVDTAGFNGSDVFSNVTDYSFPRTGAKMVSATDAGQRGFKFNGQVSNNGSTANASHPYWHSLSMNTSQYCSFNGNQSVKLDIYFPAEMGYVKLTKLQITSTDGSAWGLNGATVRTGKDTISDTSSLFGTFSSNLTLSKSEGVSCNIIRIYVSHTNGAGFGNIALSFTINQSNLTAWKNKYGIS